jgi:hypothetical protein
VHDVVGPVDLATSNFGASNPWSSGATTGVLANADTEYVGASLPPTSLPGFPLTIAAAFRYLGAASAAWSLISWGNSSSNNIANIVVTTAPGFQCFFANGATQVSLSAGFTFAVGRDYVCIFSAALGTQLLTVNGVTVISGTTAVSPAVYGTSPIVKIGDSRTGRNGNALLYWAGLWGQFLPDRQHAAIGSGGPNAIWQAFAPPAHRLLGRAAAPTARGRRTLYDRAGSRGVA